MPKSIPPLLGWLQRRVIPFYWFYSFCLLVFCFFSGSRRDTAEHIEVVAGGAVNTSKQALGLLMGLLQDNSTEEYIRNLTER